MNYTRIDAYINSQRLVFTMCPQSVHSLPQVCAWWDAWVKGRVGLIPHETKAISNWHLLTNENFFQWISRTTPKSKPHAQQWMTNTKLINGILGVHLSHNALSGSFVSYRSFVYMFLVLCFYEISVCEWMWLNFCMCFLGFSLPIYFLFLCWVFVWLSMVFFLNSSSEVYFYPRERKTNKVSELWCVGKLERSGRSWRKGSPNHNMFYYKLFSFKKEKKNIVLRNGATVKQKENQACPTSPPASSLCVSQQISRQIAKGSTCCLNYTWDIRKLGL